MDEFGNGCFLDPTHWVHHCVEGHCKDADDTIVKLLTVVGPKLYPTAPAIWKRDKLKGHSRTSRQIGLPQALPGQHFKEVTLVWHKCMRTSRCPIKADFSQFLVPQDCDTIIGTQGFLQASEFESKLKKTPDKVASGGEFDWTAYNEQKRNDTLTYALSNPDPRTKIIHACCRVSEDMIDHALDFFSPKWSRETLKLLRETGTMRFRPLDFHRGYLTKHFEAGTTKSLFDEGTWQILRPGDRTEQNLCLAFRMLMRGHGESNRNAL
jgi:hypothetical protein